jgi:hypothetical protein
MDFTKIVMAVVSDRPGSTVLLISVRHTPILAAKSKCLPPDSCHAGAVRF